MNAALRYLWIVARVNGLKSFVRSLRRPRKAIGTLIWIVVLGLVVFGQWMAAHQHGMPGGVATSSLSMFFTVLLVAGTIAGLLQHGLTFHPSAVDFLFPGPFSRRQIAFYRIAALYPITLLSSVVFLVFLSARATSLVRVAVALFLLQLVALHLQTACAIVSTAISDTLVRRFRGVGQALLGLLVSAAFLIVFFADPPQGELGAGMGIGSRVAGLFDSDTARVVFYPAVAAARVATAVDWNAALGPLCGLLACVAVSLAIAVSLPFDWLEASLATSERAARVLARARHGAATADPTGTARAKRILGERSVFTGAGAIAWKNVVSLLRSVRMMVAALLSSAIVLSFVIAFARRDFSSGDPGILSRVAPIVLLLPVLVQQYLAFDFRRDIERIEELRQLPLRPIVVAFAEVVVPAGAVFVLQLVVGGVAIAVSGLSWVWLAFAAVTLPAFTLTVVVVANLAFLLYPVRAISSSGRPNVGAASVSSILNMLGFGLACAPALVTGFFVYDQSGRTPVAVCVGLAVQFVVVTGLLALTGSAFARFDVTRSDG
ncbi:MAG: hypothetical protein IT459_02875 [Planctomycetes bacterium]|nr:hypothetical protein [Planctomycetota bacterium]